MQNGLLADVFEDALSEINASPVLFPIAVARRVKTTTAANFGWRVIASLVLRHIGWRRWVG